MMEKRVHKRLPMCVCVCICVCVCMCDCLPTKHFGMENMQWHALVTVLLIVVLITVCVCVCVCGL
jgi:amino acid permease